MGATGLARIRKAANPSRLANKRAHTAPIEHLNPGAVRPLNLGLRAAGLKIRAQLVLTGDDIPTRPQAAQLDDEDLIGPHSDLDALVDRIWAQFGFDLIQVSPNLKSRAEGAYITLSHEEQLAATLDLFKRPVLPFCAVWWRVRDKPYWDIHQFDRFFPPKEKELQRMQNFPSCRYFQLWLRLRSQMPPTHFDRLRAKLLPLFRTLYWLPHTDSERLWDTRTPQQTVHSWTFISTAEHRNRRGVKIALNPYRHSYLHTITLGHKESV
ncbi:hypothetical protein FKP32DRAFT_1559601 [Trametes sanguinea]|nr:hypothetical protein FKP32DRAFT_1559601 [Trametes sanguinea]